MEYHWFPDKATAQAAAVDRLTNLLQTANRNHTRVLLLLSGGSNIDVTLKIPKDILQSESVTLMVADERYSSDSAVNNSLVMRNKGIPVTQLLPVDTESLEHIAVRHEAALRAWRLAHPTGVIIAQLGIGEDGHLAGISPMSQEWDRVFTTDRWVVGYSGNLQPPQRITVTPNFLITQVDAAVVFVAGATKGQALTRIFAQEGSLSQTPARILRDMKQVDIFSDIVDINISSSDTPEVAGKLSTR